LRYGREWIVRSGADQMVWQVESEGGVSKMRSGSSGNVPVHGFECVARAMDLRALWIQE
jgi:hypothetical protein